LKVKCRFYSPGSTPNSTSESTVPAKILVINDNWGLEFSAVFILCHLYGAPLPASVSVMTGDSRPPSNKLPVQNQNEMKADVTSMPKVGVCVKQMRFNQSIKVGSFNFSLEAYYPEFLVFFNRRSPYPSHCPTSNLYSGASYCTGISHYYVYILLPGPNDSSSQIAIPINWSGVLVVNRSG
jgi:hypothetical protein